MKNTVIAASPLDIPVMPCPWCGDTDVKVVEGSTFRWRVAQCQTCGAQTGEVRTQTMGEGTVEEWRKQAVDDAMDAWNERHNAKITGC